MTAVVALTEAKAELIRIRKMHFFKSYASLQWMSSFMALLHARAHLYFHKTIGGGVSGISNISPSSQPNLIKKPEWSLMAQYAKPDFAIGHLICEFRIESNVVKHGALCACLIYNGLDPDSRPAMLKGYQFPEDIDRPSGLGSWPCLYSFSSTVRVMIEMEFWILMATLDGIQPRFAYGKYCVFANGIRREAVRESDPA